MVSEKFPSSFPLGADLDSVEIWKKGEQFVVVMSPPKGKKGKKQAAPWVAFDLKTKVYKEKEGMYTGECPALEVASQGDDEQEARENIQEAVALFLEDCADVGTLERVLLKRKFKAIHKQKEVDHDKTIHGMIVPFTHDASQKQWQDKMISDRFVPATS